MGDRISSDSTRPRPAPVLLAALSLATVACVRADGGSRPAAGPPEDARRLHVLYLPNATPEQVGLPTDHAWGGPWMGSSGTAKAHVMFAPG